MSMKKVNGKTYNRVECCFNTESQTDTQLYNYLVKRSKMVGKSSFIKQLIYNAMEQESQR